MKIERYIDRKQFLFLSMASLISTALLSTFAGLEILRFLSGRNADSPSIFIKLLWMKIPLLFSVSLPISVFTGITGSYYLMKLNGELIGTLGIGFDYRKYVMRKIPAFILLSLLHFAFNEEVVSRSERAFTSTQASVDRKMITQKFSNIWLKIGNAFVHIDNILPFEGKLIGIEIIEVVDHNVKKYIKSKTAEIKEGTLKIPSAEVVEFEGGKINTKIDSYKIGNFPLLRGKKELSESDLFSIPLSECINIIKAIEKEGGSATVYRNILYVRVILPSMTFVSAFLGNTTPLFASFSSTLSFFISPLIFLTVLLSIYFSTSLSFKGLVPSSLSLIIFLGTLIALSIYILLVSGRSETKQSL